MADFLCSKKCTAGDLFAVVEDLDEERTSFKIKRDYLVMIPKKSLA
jgi:hypothetical protein